MWFRSYNGYFNHKIKVHKMTHPNLKKCLKCGEQFVYNNQLFDHCRIEHGASNLICNLCGSTFKYQSSFLRHKLTCENSANIWKKIACTTCNKRFATKKYLLDHIKGQRSPPSYCCDLCTSQFRYRSSLAYHKKRKHKKTD